ncbi:MAG: hypothetical protein ACTSUE_19095 [Promethearchaeota archaeon]
MPSWLSGKGLPSSFRLNHAYLEGIIPATFADNIRERGNAGTYL